MSHSHSLFTHTISPDFVAKIPHVKKYQLQQNALCLFFDSKLNAREFCHRHKGDNRTFTTSILINETIAVVLQPTKIDKLYQPPPKTLNDILFVLYKTYVRARDIEIEIEPDSAQYPSPQPVSYTSLRDLPPKLSKNGSLFIRQMDGFELDVETDNSEEKRCQCHCTIS